MTWLIEFCLQRPVALSDNERSLLASHVSDVIASGLYDYDVYLSDEKGMVIYGSLTAGDDDELALAADALDGLSDMIADAKVTVAGDAPPFVDHRYRGVVQAPADLNLWTKASDLDLSETEEADALDDDWADEPFREKVQLKPRQESAPGGLRLLDIPEMSTRIGSDGDTNVQLDALLKNQLGKAMELNGLHVVMRDEHGHLVWHEEQCPCVKFRSVQETVVEFDMATNILRRVAFIDIIGECEVRHRTPLGSWKMEEVSMPRHQGDVVVLPLVFEPPPPNQWCLGYKIEVDASLCFRWDEYQLLVQLELIEEVPSRYASMNLLLSVRDEMDQMVVREKVYVEDAQDGGPTWANARLVLRRNQIPRLRTLKVIVAGESRRRQHLGRYEVMR